MFFRGIDEIEFEDMSLIRGWKGLSLNGGIFGLNWLYGFDG